MARKIEKKSGKINRGLSNTHLLMGLGDGYRVGVGYRVAPDTHTRSQKADGCSPELVQLWVSRSTRKLDIRLSVVRIFNAAKHGKTRKSPTGRPSPQRISGMKRRIEKYEQMPHIRTPCRNVASKAELENSIRNMCLVGTKFREKNDDDGRNFALNSG